ncbi:MAG: CHRD domain-containing protein [Pyrinomonadaceae bacterium]|nr:CHRD domain-containing protein [Pyrinomonadaceae bacterium]
MRVKFLAGVFTVLMLAGTALADTFFTADLNAAQEVPPNGSTATGFGRVTLNPEETEVRVSVLWLGLSGGATGGHIHGPAPAGANGPIIFNLNPAATTSGTVIAQNFAVTPQQVADLKAGLWYFNIHTAANSGGEIRGQILVDSPFIAYMDPNQEVPATSTAARGYGAVSLNAAGTIAYVNMIFLNLSGPATAGHVHQGRSGTNGPVVQNLAPPSVTSGGSVDFIWNLTAGQATLLKQGQFYLNVHTAANPGGEIRGQIQRRRSTVLDFDGDSKTDYANTRSNATAGTTEWWINLSGGGISAFPFGLNTDNVRPRTVACDFDGDGKDDPAIWRTGATPAAAFYIYRSSDFTVQVEQFGTTGDNPSVVNDYDGDGRCDVAVYRPTSPSTWYYLGSANNPNKNITYTVFGLGSFPNPGDYDGDGRGDFMVQSNANWWILHADGTIRVVNFGTGSFFGNPGDFDGDGKTDVAGSITEGSNRAWYYVSSLNPAQNVYNTRVAFGDTSARRAQGDYDGDGKSDPGVYVTSTTISPVPTYWVLNSSNGSVTTVPWGLSTDISVNNYNNR